jgi:hypothetical protein
MEAQAPGFTAEKSLKVSGQKYGGAVRYGESRAAGVVMAVRVVDVYHCHCASDGCICHYIGTVLAW